VVIDDFYGWLPLNFMLQLMDRYPMQVPVKGGYVNWAPRFIYITSNKHYVHWYKWLEHGNDMLRAFERRIDKLVHFDYDSEGLTVTTEEEANLESGFLLLEKE